MSRETNERPSGSSRPGAARGTGWLVAAALLIGLAIGHRGIAGSPAVAADPSPDATATRAAELTELNDLQTRVAQTVVCTQAATDTPTATPSPEPTATQVPAVAADTPLPYGDVWQVTVHSIDTVAATGGFKVQGQLVKVNLTFENVTNDAQFPPFADWRLVDASGNRYPASPEATSAYGSGAYGLVVAAHTSADRTLVFDIPVDAGTTFTLESTEDPNFRVELTFVARG